MGRSMRSLVCRSPTMLNLVAEKLHTVKAELMPWSPMSQGLDVLAPSQHAGNLARPRLFEIGAAVNRLRSAKMRQQR